MSKLSPRLARLVAFIAADQSYAKTVWAFSIVIQVSTVIWATVAPALTKPGYAAIVLISALAIVAYLLKWHSDSIRSTADTSFRKVEGEDHLGWAISNKELGDIEATGSTTAADQAESAPSEHWTSNAPAGPKRTVETVQESAFWSEHLARTMGRVAGATAAIFLVLGIVALFVVLGNKMSDDRAAAIAKAILATLSVSFTGGFIRMSLDYYSFAKSCGNIDARADGLLKQTNIDLVDAIRILHDYQVIRSKSPPIPDLVHRIRRKKLNSAWDRRRAAQLLANGETKGKYLSGSLVANAPQTVPPEAPKESKEGTAK